MQSIYTELMMNSPRGVPYAAYFMLDSELVGFGPLDESRHVYNPPRRLNGLHESGRLRYSKADWSMTDGPNSDGELEIKHIGFQITIVDPEE